MASSTKVKDRTSSFDLSKADIPSSNGGLTCVISKDTVMEGTFRADQDVRLDGKIVGDVKCSKRLVMGESGHIDGTVMAKDAIILGTIDGELKIQETLHLKPTAVINGNISAKSIVVDEGARYNGECKIGANN